MLFHFHSAKQLKQYQHCSICILSCYNRVYFPQADQKTHEIKDLLSFKDQGQDCWECEQSQPVLRNIGFPIAWQRKVIVRDTDLTAPWTWPSHHFASFTVCFCFCSAVWSVTTQLCANMESFLKTGLGALSPDVLGYEVCSEVWEFIPLKCSLCGLYPTNLWALVWEGHNTANLSISPSLTAALGKSIISFTYEILFQSKWL